MYYDDGGESAATVCGIDSGTTSAGLEVKPAKQESHGVQMGEIALLILDECHHCKKRHPANLIMQQFWHPAPVSTRPRIFGMTASPVDTKKGSKGSLQSLFAELEANLGAKVWATLAAMLQ